MSPVISDSVVLVLLVMLSALTFPKFKFLEFLRTAIAEYVFLSQWGDLYRQFWRNQTLYARIANKDAPTLCDIY
ncbi:hypothetical protein C7W93_10715 [Glaciimonas sp. PCH181]|nr:hypothetical protein C7W93_10715 [Glaciimonas sp. PCH181]